jgi:hypothetical protein
VCCAFLSVPGCSTTHVPGVHLALEGPPLVVAAKVGNRYFEGSMERSGMAGVGIITLREEATGAEFRGSLDAPASPKGRLYVVLSCAQDARTLHLVLRNLGPDQGMGIGRLSDGETRMILFYHPGRADAWRRLAQLRAELDVLVQDKP